MIYYESNELYHHGILGQKWGVRRYQNPDGTLTAAGKKRYGDHVENVNKKRLTDQMKKSFASGNSTAQAYASKQSKIAYSKADKTAEGKAYHEVDDYYGKLHSDLKKQYGENALLFLTKDETDAYNSLKRSYEKKAMEFFYSSEYKNNLAGKVLTDMGYKDTAVGRDYVKSIIEEQNKDNPMWKK